MTLLMPLLYPHRSQPQGQKRANECRHFPLDRKKREKRLKVCSSLKEKELTVGERREFCWDVENMQEVVYKVFLKNDLSTSCSSILCNNPLQNLTASNEHISFLSSVGLLDRSSVDLMGLPVQLHAAGGFVQPAGPLSPLS